MHEADLQVGVVAGEHIDEIHLLSADNLRKPLAVFMRQHVQIVMRQLVGDNIGPVLGAQNTDPDRRRGDDFTVKLLMLFQTLGVVFRRNKDAPLIHARQRKQYNPHQHIEQYGVEDKHPDTLQHQIDRHGIDNAERRRRQAFFQDQLLKARRIAKPRALLLPLTVTLKTRFRTGERKEWSIVFIQDRHTHRHAARGKEVFNADGLLNTQQPLQAVRQVDRHQGVEITDARTRARRYPEQAVAALVLRRVAILNNALMQRLESFVALKRDLPQAEIRHTEVIGAYQKHAV